MRGSDATDRLLADQVAYYRAVAADYESRSLPGWGGDEVEAALAAFRPAGDVLEMACGPGTWTELLLRHASSVLAIDAAPEMLERARQRVADSRVRFVQADVFTWQPPRGCFDVVFFGFWLSHVPRDRLAAFWSLVGRCLRPGGRVFFVDDAFRAPEELVEGASSDRVQRRLDSGAVHRLLKIPYQPSELEGALASLGWQVAVTRTSGHFYWGTGHRSTGGPVTGRTGAFAARPPRL